MQSEDTLAVLALDAADPELVERWGCDNLKLNTHGSIETFAHTLDLPYTPEVWCTVATGVSPDTHGVGDSSFKWDNPILRAASKATQFLPHYHRRQLGRIVAGGRAEKDEMMSFEVTDHNHVFEAGLVKGWPGITPADNLSAAWADLGAAAEGDITDSEFQNRLVTRTGEELGWLAAAVEYGEAPVAGVHSHILDAAGHTYADDEATLRRMYRVTDSMVGELRERVDRLVILSDHGMQAVCLDDTTPGKHSWRAMMSTTEAGPLPESVFEVRDWIESRLTQADREESGAVSMDETTAEHLQDLGYLEG